MTLERTMVLEEHEPRWQPISELPAIATLIQDFVDETQEQWCTLSSIRDQHDTINETILEAVVMVYTEHLRHANVFRDQLIKWQHEALERSQSDTIVRLLGQVHRLTDLSGKIVTTSCELLQHRKLSPELANGGGVAERQSELA